MDQIARQQYQTPSRSGPTDTHSAYDDGDWVLCLASSSSFSSSTLSCALSNGSVQAYDQTSLLPLMSSLPRSTNNYLVTVDTVQNRWRWNRSCFRIMYRNSGIAVAGICLTLLLRHDVDDGWTIVAPSTSTIKSSIIQQGSRASRIYSEPALSSASASSSKSNKKKNATTTVLPFMATTNQPLAAKNNKPSAAATAEVVMNEPPSNDNDDNNHVAAASSLSDPAVNIDTDAITKTTTTTTTTTTTGSTNMVETELPQPSVTVDVESDMDIHFMKIATELAQSEYVCRSY